METTGVQDLPRRGRTHQPGARRREPCERRRRPGTPIHRVAQALQGRNNRCGGLCRPFRAWRTLVSCTDLFWPLRGSRAVFCDSGNAIADRSDRRGRPGDPSRLASGVFDALGEHGFRCYSSSGGKEIFWHGNWIPVLIPLPHIPLPVRFPSPGDFRQCDNGRRWPKPSGDGNRRSG